MDQRRTTGAQGEQIAAAHLEGLGWTVIDRNWRSGRLGELDVVALQPGPGRLGTLVFCEVKTRRGLGYGDPLEAITYKKLGRPGVRGPARGDHVQEARTAAGAGRSVAGRARGPV